MHKQHHETFLSACNRMGGHPASVHTAQGSRAALRAAAHQHGNPACLASGAVPGANWPHTSAIFSLRDDNLLAFKPLEFGSQCG